MRFRCESCGAQYAISDEKLGKKGVKVRCKKCSNIITVRPPPPEPESSDDQAQDNTDAGQNRDDTNVDGEPMGGQSEAEDEFGSQVGSPSSSVTGNQENLAAGADDGLDLGDDDDLHDALNGLLGDDETGDDLDDEEDEDADLDHQSTRVFNVEEMQQVQSEREQASVLGGEQEQDSPSHGDVGDEENSDEVGQRSGPQGDGDRDKVEWYAAVDDEQVGPICLNEFAKRWKNGEFDSETLVWKSGFEDWLTIFDVADFAFLAEEESAIGEEESARERDDESDWSPSFGGRSEPASFDDGEPEGAHGDAGAAADEYDSHDDEGQGYSGFDDDESSSSASSAAFAADVDWKPAALSSLTNLAEEELASLKPEDPEDELPFDPDGDFPSEQGLDFDGQMDDGDSSLVAQIAAEEEAIRKAQEEQIDELEKQSEGDQVSDDPSEMLAKQKAQKEKRAEQPAAVSAVDKPYTPPRSSLPKWAIGLMVGGGLMMLTLVGVVGYLLAQGNVTDKPLVQPVAVHQGSAPSAANNSVVVQPSTKAQGLSAVQPKSDSPGVQGLAGTQVASAAKTKPQNAGASKPPDSRISSSAIGPEGKKADKADKADKKANTKTPRMANTKTISRARKTKYGNRKKRKVKKSNLVAKAPKEEVKVRRSKPKRNKPKGGLLDFEDPDDRAFAAETGIKAPKTVPKVAKKKELPPLSNADVLTVMKRHLAEFKACNRKQKQVDSTVRGKMVVSFTIGNNGRVVKVGVSKKTARFRGTYVGGCIKSIIKRLRFPAFGGPKKTIPFPFSVN